MLPHDQVIDQRTQPEGRQVALPVSAQCPHCQNTVNLRFNMSVDVVVPETIEAQVKPA